MPVERKNFVEGQSHLQPPARRLPKKTVLGIAQSLSIRRKDAKPPTIDTPPWEKEQTDD
ncbi:hypothetical protein [Tritonibacter mobilis]|uniref:hypothetical protein n=1 Tax=Tritonibacter mobilis TaxID=379347 RepID=UPI0013A54E2B|nr:hypothetical protein [Tritonibacter mobilis]